jgi:hypothetical protein
MAALTDRAFEEAYGPKPAGAAYLLKRQVTRPLRAFLTGYQAPLARQTDVTILDLERRLDAEAGGFAFTGILDRIEKRGARTVIVDYKPPPARPPRHRLRDDLDERGTWNRAIGSLQLPLYLFLYMQHHPTPIEDLAACFLLLGQARMDERIEAPLFRDDGQAGACYGKVKEVMFRLVREIADPKVPFDTRFRAKEPCRFCDYRYICGTQQPGK